VFRVWKGYKHSSKQPDLYDEVVARLQENMIPSMCSRTCMKQFYLLEHNTCILSIWVHCKSPNIMLRLPLRSLLFLLFVHVSERHLIVGKHANPCTSIYIAVLLLHLWTACSCRNCRMGFACQLLVQELSHLLRVRMLCVLCGCLCKNRKDCNRLHINTLLHKCQDQYSNSSSTAAGTTPLALFSSFSIRSILLQIFLPFPSNF
jgi:hypothetical protein